MEEHNGTLIVNCIGGLGNQMFAYAAGRSLARRFNRKLEVVMPPTSHQQWSGYARPFQLSQFQIRGTLRQAGFLERLLFSNNRKLKSLQAAAGLLGIELVRERHAYRYESELKLDPARSSAYLNGYWQSAAYAEAVESELREEFTLRAPLQGRNSELARQISRLACPVSVHVRLGDYAQISHAGVDGSTRVSQVLPASYFQHAFEAVRAALGEFTPVLFSDEPEKARGLLPETKQLLLIEGNGAERAYEELYLMSLCKHHVIANSSFSWWGAWLNASVEKRVFAPQFWGNTPESYFPDLCPRGWTLIDNMAA
jgi:hypothetical protein